MTKFLLLKDAQTQNVTQHILVGTAHIAEVRPQGNPISDGCVVTLATGRQIAVADTFDEIINRIELAQ